MNEKRSKTLSLFLLFFFIILTKLSLSVLLPIQGTADSIIYYTVASNITNNKCVSRSEVNTKECAPDWGGNQLFGYPLFLGLSGADSKSSLINAVLIQNLLLSLSIIYFLVIVSNRFKLNKRYTTLLGVTLTLSPLQLGWANSILTEALALSIIFLFLAETTIAIFDKKIKVIRWGVLLLFAFFVRYEFAVLCIAVPLLCFYSYNSKTALLKTVSIGLIVLLPTAIWVARSVSLGLPVPPKLAMVEPHLKYTEGFDRWFRSWSVKASDNPSVFWKVLRAQYSQVSIDDYAFNSEEQKKQVLKLFEVLIDYEGESIPDYIDKDFYIIGTENIENRSFAFYVLNPLTRLKNMFLDFSYDHRLPIRMTTKEEQAFNMRIKNASTIPDFMSIATVYPKKVIFITLIAVYKLAIYLFFAFLIFKVIKIEKKESYFIYCSLIIITSHLFFILAFTRSTEVRYSTLSILIIELCSLILLCQYLSRKQNVCS